MPDRVSKLKTDHRSVLSLSPFRPRTSFAVRSCLAALGALLVLAPAAAHATPSLVIEVDSGKVLLADDATKPWYPASVTKLMTAYVTFQAMRAGRVTAETLITVSPNAVAQQPSKMGFIAGTKVTVDNALKMMLVKSANDMAVVLAEGVGGSLPAFINEMNTAARDLGMTGTHYENPNGLPDSGQVTTARDLAVLARAILLEYPEHADLFRIPAIKVGNNVIRSYNKLIDRYPGADGMKTGFICASGFNLVASAHRGDKRILAIVLGTNSGKDRTEQAALLLEKGFQHSWKIFGAVAPTVDSLKNEGGPPTDMKAQVCGGKRKNVASEADYDTGPSPTGFVASGMGGLGDKVTGASLLTQLPPSMPPVPVWVGPFPDQAALDAAYPRPVEKKKPAAAAAPGKKKTASQTPAQTTIVIDPANPDAAPAAKPAAKPAGKPAAKPAAKPATKPVATTSKPAGTASAKPAAKPVAKPAPAPIYAPVPAPTPVP